VVQLDVDDGRRDKQRELPDPCHAIRPVRGVEADQRLHPPVVWGCPWGRHDHRHPSTQVLDDAMGGDVPRASEHNVECLVTLVVTGLEVRMAINCLEVPFGFLEPHSIPLVLFRVCLMFALPLAGRRAIAALLLPLLAVLFHELLDLLALLGAVACGVVHWTTHPSIIATGCLTGALVASGTSAPTHCGSSNCGGRSRPSCCCCSCCHHPGHQCSLRARHPSPLLE
jgi:hypothetical protein